MRNLFSQLAELNKTKNRSISMTEKILFTQRLSLYMHAGIPIGSALKLLREDARGKRVIAFYDFLIIDITHGRSLANALKRFPRSFNSFHINLVHVGETSGTLAPSLLHLSKSLKQRSALQKKMIGAAVYPLIICVGTISVTLFLVLYAFPKIIPLFKGFHAALPLPTRILISISEAFAHHTIMILAGATFLLIGIIFGYKNIRVWNRVQQYVLYVPIISNTIILYHVATICRTLSTLLESTIPIERAFSLTREGVTHPSYRRSLENIRDAVGRGSTIGKEIRLEPKLYPNTVAQLISAGEITGTLSESLHQVANIYEEQLEEMMRNMSTLIEPALMIGMGLVVGFVAMAIITPIYGLTQNLTVH